MKTLQELEKNNYEANYYSMQGYIPVEAKCNKCGHQLYKNKLIVLTSYPPMFQYWCPYCGNVETSILNLSGE